MQKRSNVAFWRRLLQTPRYEILPTANITAQVVEHVPIGHTITITSSVSLGISATLETAKALQGQGYRAIPHLAARMVSGRTELEDIVDQLLTAGIGSIFVPAGDAMPAAGPYSSSVDLLGDLTAIGAPFGHVGVTGYPESHPSIHDDLTIQAMWDKRAHASHIVSNLCFDPEVLATWVHRIRARGVTMPLLIGMAGQVERTKLVAMAAKIGIGESSRFLSKNKSILARIAAPGGYRPERFIERITPTLSRPEANVEGLHLFTFNQVAATERWRQDWLARLEDNNSIAH